MSYVVFQASIQTWLFSVLHHSGIDPKMYYVGPNVNIDLIFVLQKKLLLQGKHTLILVLHTFPSPRQKATTGVLFWGAPTWIST